MNESLRLGAIETAGCVHANGGPHFALAAAFNTESSAATDPIMPDPVAPDATMFDSIAPDPIAVDPLAIDPVAPDAIATDSVAPDSVAPDSVAPDSAASDPIASDSIASDPVASDPVPPPLAPVELRAIGIKKNYRKGPVDIPVLRGVDLEVRSGEFLAIIGQSGSGKSTLLHLLGTLDAPTSGEVHFDGRRIDNLPAAERDCLRNTQFGMIFQFYHLLPELTTLENVLSPLMIRYGAWNYRRRRREHLQAARELLELVGLSHRLKHRPRELSGEKCSGRPSRGL